MVAEAAEVDAAEQVPLQPAALVTPCPCPVPMQAAVLLQEADDAVVAAEKRAEAFRDELRDLVEQASNLVIDPQVPGCPALCDPTPLPTCPPTHLPPSRLLPTRSC